MGLLDDLTPTEKVWPCAVRDTAAQLDESDSAALYRAVANTAWKYQALENALAEKGVHLSQGAIKRHRLGLCSCGRVKTNA